MTEPISQVEQSLEETLKALRLKFKKAVHQLPTIEAFRDAAVVCDTLRGHGLGEAEALAKAAEWLCAHAKGPSVDEWKQLLRFHVELTSRKFPNTAAQRLMIEVTYFLVQGLKRWKRHLRKHPHIFDGVINATVPALARTPNLPLAPRLALIEAVEAQLASLRATPLGKCRLAELRIQRAFLLIQSPDDDERDEAFDILQAQREILKQLAAKNVEDAAEAITRTDDKLAQLRAHIQA